MAEKKLDKFGETQTGGAEGNTEPSVINEGVETRRRVCKNCGKPIPDKRYKNALYCSIACRTRYSAQQYKIRKGKIKKPGVGSGGNQLGTDNHQWKNGIGAFRRIAFDNYPHECNNCKSTKNLNVHHIDKNRNNNNLSNLVILCARCHRKIHNVRDPVTGKYIKV